MISHVLMKNNKPLLFLNVSELEDGTEEFIYFINLHQLYSSFIRNIFIRIISILLL